MATKAVLSEAEVGVLVKDIYGKVYKINCNLTVTVRDDYTPHDTRWQCTAKIFIMARHGVLR